MSAMSSKLCGVLQNVYSNVIRRQASLLSSSSASLFHPPQQSVLPNIKTRQFSTSNVSHLKEIVRVSEGNKIVVEAKYVKSPREDLLVKHELSEQKVCPLCALNLNLKHTDVLVLSQFVRPDGRIIPRRISGLCCSSQYKITHLITMAKKAGLMPNLAPANSHKDPTKRRKSRKLHRYFDESTIKDTRLKNVLKYRPEIAF